VKFAEVAELAVRTFGLDKRYYVGPGFAWADDFRIYDPNLARRSMRPDAIEVDFTVLNFSHPPANEHSGFIYLELPNVFNTDVLNRFKERNRLVEVRPITFNGYSIRAYVFAPGNSDELPLGVSP
jgi:hypothetical protein